MSESDGWVGALRVLVAVVGISNVAVGLWALIAPHGWYRMFPGFGRHWLPPLGAYDEHLARDAGSGLLAIGILLVWAALAPRAGLLLPAVVCSLAFGVPHLAYHVASSDHLPAADNAVNLVLLTLAVALPAALLWAFRWRGAGRQKSGAGPGGARG